MADPPGDLNKILNNNAVSAGEKAQPSIVPAAPALCVCKKDHSRFDASWFGQFKFDLEGRTALPQFRELLGEHNDRLTKNAAMRATILSMARTEAAEFANPSGIKIDKILEPILTLYQDSMRKMPYAPPSLLARMDADRGNSGAFDPWNGWWAGPYSNPGGSWFNLHVWDQTIMFLNNGIQQYVQPVTQLDVTIDWFASAGRLEQHPDRTDYADYAVNVWSQRDGVTGYVFKNLFDSAKTESLMHIGFLIEPNVLVWIATVEPKGGQVDGVQFPLLLFVEPVFPSVSPLTSFDGKYAIHGAVAAARWNAGAFEFVGPFSEINDHRGDYSGVLPTIDRTSLECAITQTGLDGMDGDIAEYIVQRAR